MKMTIVINSVKLLAMTVNIEKFRALLKELKAQTESDIAYSEESTKPVELDQTMIGRVSRMDAMQQQQMALASERRRQRILQKIEHALKRIENEEYGYCIKCDEEINEKRLEFDPTILTCITCATGL